MTSNGNPHTSNIIDKYRGERNPHIGKCTLQYIGRNHLEEAPPWRSLANIQIVPVCVITWTGSNWPYHFHMELSRYGRLSARSHWGQRQARTNKTSTLKILSWIFFFIFEALANGRILPRKAHHNIQLSSRNQITNATEHFKRPSFNTGWIIFAYKNYSTMDSVRFSTARSRARRIDALVTILPLHCVMENILNDVKQIKARRSFDIRATNQQTKVIKTNCKYVISWN